MIIGIAGSGMGVGKDTVADILVAQYEYVKLSFGTELKREVQHALATRVFPTGINSLCRDAMMICLLEGKTNPFAKPTSDAMRIVLQQWGTEYRRAADQDYWVNAVQRTIDEIYFAQNGFNFFTIADCRFVNERDWVKAEGGQMWYVDGPSRLTVGVQKKHASEGAITPEMCDRVIQNVKGLDSLVRDVLIALAATPGAIPVPGILASHMSLEAAR